MNRKGSDLLDVFRSTPRRPSGEGSRGGGGEGRTLTLGRRHLVVVGAGAVLIVVLAFVAGIGIGRGGSKGGAGVALARPGAVRSWRLPGAALPRIGSRAEEVLPLVRAQLERDWPQLVGHYRIEDVPSAPGKAPRIRFTVVGIRNRDEAEKWQSSLIGWYVAGHVPFENVRPEPE